MIVSFVCTERAIHDLLGEESLVTLQKLQCQLPVSIPFPVFFFVDVDPSFVSFVLLSLKMIVV